MIWYGTILCSLPAGLCRVCAGILITSAGSNNTPCLGMNGILYSSHSARSSIILVRVSWISSRLDLRFLAVVDMHWKARSNCRTYCTVASRELDDSVLNPRIQAPFLPRPTNATRNLTGIYTALPVLRWLPELRIAKFSLFLLVAESVY